MNATRTTWRHRLLVLWRLVVVLCALAAPRIHGGEALYAIAGAPISEMGMDFPVVLYRIGDGDFTKVRTVATRRQNAIVIKSYPGEGLVFIVSNGATAGWFLVDILDLTEMSRERSVDFDLCRGCGYDKARLLDRNGRLIFYIQAGHYERETDTLVTQFLGLDIESAEFVYDIARSDDAYLIHSGMQSGGVDGSDFVRGILVREGSPDQPYVARDRETFDLDWRLPEWYSEGGQLDQLANNRHARVLLSTAGADGEQLVLNKRSGRWSSVPLSTLPVGGTRLLRNWLVREDYRAGYDPVVWQGYHLGDLDPKPFWSAEDLPERLPFWSAEGRASLRGKTQTGRLQFYDVQTGALAEHDTGHPDSEILLIDENDQAYFRVGDELRRAKIEDGGLADEELVAKAPELLGVHWLFRGVD